MSKLLTLEEIIAKAQHRRASDIHIVCGIPIRLRVDGRLVDMDDNVMTAADCESYARDLSNHYDDIAHIGEQDLALGFADGTRCRVNLFRHPGFHTVGEDHRIQVIEIFHCLFQQLGTVGHEKARFLSDFPGGQELFHLLQKAVFPGCDSLFGHNLHRLVST